MEEANKLMLNMHAALLKQDTGVISPYKRQYLEDNAWEINVDMGADNPPSRQ